MKRFTSWLAAFFILGFSAASAKTFSKTEVKTFDISPNGKVVLENVNGNIKVESWNKNQVMVQVTKTVKADDQEDANEYFGRVGIEIVNEKDYLEIHTHYPNGEGWEGFWHWLFQGGSRNPNVDYVMKVPSTIKLDAGSTNGNVEIHSIAGGVEASSTNGNVEVHSATGVVKASSTNGWLNFDSVGGEIEGSTTNGGITAAISDSTGFQGLRLETTNGSIKIFCPEDLNANVSAHTTNGSIETQLPVMVQGEFGRKNFEGKINKGGAPIDLRTTNGSIQINKR